jgi:hypothetical protein
VKARAVVGSKRKSISTPTNSQCRSLLLRGQAFEDFRRTNRSLAAVFEVVSLGGFHGVTGDDRWREKR